MLFDIARHTPLSYHTLDEWPTCLSASPSLPLIAVGGASGTLKLVEYLAGPENDEEAAEEAAAIDAAEEAGVTVEGLLRSTAAVDVHCHNVREVCFAGAMLFTAGDDEVAQWQLPHF